MGLPNFTSTVFGRGVHWVTEIYVGSMSVQDADVRKDVGVWIFNPPPTGIVCVVLSMSNNLESEWVVNG